MLTRNPNARRLYTSVQMANSISKEVGEFGKPIGPVRGFKIRKAANFTSDDEEEVVISKVSKTKIKKTSQAFNDRNAWRREVVERREKEELTKRPRQR